MNRCGDDIISLLARAERDVLIVAPFIRSSPLARLLRSIQESVDVLVVTRWRPADILAGASDLGVFDLTEANSIPLLLRHDLHAKLFIADDRCLIGSANVTATALGWRAPSNLELLAPADRSSPGISTFLTELQSGSVPATRNHQVRLRELVEQLRQKQSFIVPETADDENTPGLLPPDWMPGIMNPDELYAVYARGAEADVSRAVLPGMVDELSQLGVSPGMNESEFRAWVSSFIVQTPVVVGVLQRIEVEGSVNEKALAQLFDEIGVDLNDHAPREGLRTLQRWLTYFLSDGYETTPESIRLIKAKEI